MSRVVSWRRCPVAVSRVARSGLMMDCPSVERHRSTCEWPGLVRLREYITVANRVNKKKNTPN